MASGNLKKLSATSDVKIDKSRKNLKVHALG